MSGLKNKIKVMFDIIPKFVEDSIEAEQINLKQNAETKNIEVESQQNQEDHPIFRDVSQGDTSKHLDDLVADILEGNLSDDIKYDLENVISSTEDPIVELAKVGAIIGRTNKWQGDLRTKDGYPETAHIEVELQYGDQLQKTEDFYKEIINKIREPVSSRVATTLGQTIKMSSLQVAKMPFAGNKNLISQAKPLQVLPVKYKEEQKEKVKEEINAKIVEEEVISFYKNEPKEEIKASVASMSSISTKLDFKPKPLNFTTPAKKRRTGLWLSIIIIIGAGAYSMTLKNELFNGGQVAFGDLQSASESLKHFNFNDASKSFNKSYQELSQISQTMNFMGAGLIGYLGDLPGFDTLTTGGLSKVKSSKDMVEAGKLLAKAGVELSDALGLLGKTGSVLNPTDNISEKPLNIVNQIRDALILSNNNFKKAQALISNIDDSVIPEDKRDNFNDFKKKLPLFEEYLDDAIEYTDFLEGVIGIDKPRKYLLLFNNNSELRPTGGFPGTYGIVYFTGGGLEDFFVNDVYNLDGQLRRNIIPPKQLQHITPTWGMRDSSWFIDFPSSAKKAMEFFSEEAGFKVDGIIALNPDIVTGILSVIGPIEMPEYDMTLTADNFVESIQEEVEYGDNRIQPKKVVVDFGPRFLEKLYSANPDEWVDIFNVLTQGLNEKDILFYFNDKELENFAIDEGFGGEVKNTQGDYMMVNFSNVKGSKTDVVTDSNIEINTRFESGQVIHRAIITREHNGGDYEHGFYNRQNPAYIRVLIPENAELLSISGNDLPNFKPLLNYSLAKDFEKDRDLTFFESGFSSSRFIGVDTFEESGKKGIGFWMITDPNTTKKIEFEYSVPITGLACDSTGKTCDYNFYFQKQPGLDWKNFNFKIGDSSSYAIDEITPGPNRIGNFYVYNQLLNKDFEINIKFKNK